MNTNTYRNRNRNEHINPHRINSPDSTHNNNRNGNGQPQVPSYHRSIRNINHFSFPTVSVLVQNSSSIEELRMTENNSRNLFKHNLVTYFDRNFE